MASERLRLRCRFGFHRTTRIPPEVLARAYRAGLRIKLPDWYAGRTVASYCIDCEQPAGTTEEGGQ
jgi:hypothetical protein